MSELHFKLKANHGYHFMKPYNAIVATDLFIYLRELKFDLNFENEDFEIIILL